MKAEAQINPRRALNNFMIRAVDFNCSSEIEVDVERLKFMKLTALTTNENMAQYRAKVPPGVPQKNPARAIVTNALAAIMVGAILTKASNCSR